MVREKLIPRVIWTKFWPFYSTVEKIECCNNPTQDKLGDDVFNLKALISVCFMSPELAMDWAAIPAWRQYGEDGKGRAHPKRAVYGGYRETVGGCEKGCLATSLGSNALWTLFSTQVMIQQ